MMTSSAHGRVGDKGQGLNIGKEEYVSCPNFVVVYVRGASLSSSSANVSVGFYEEEEEGGAVLRILCVRHFVRNGSKHNGSSGFDRQGGFFAFS